jgi:hypothetical protein
MLRALSFYKMDFPDWGNYKAGISQWQDKACLDYRRSEQLLTNNQ